MPELDKPVVSQVYDPKQDDRLNWVLPVRPNPVPIKQTPPPTPPPPPPEKK